MEKMLAKDLSATEKEEFKVMLRKHPSLLFLTMVKLQESRRYNIRST